MFDILREYVGGGALAVIKFFGFALLLMFGFKLLGEHNETANYVYTLFAYAIQGIARFFGDTVPKIQWTEEKLKILASMTLTGFVYKATKSERLETLFTLTLVLMSMWVFGYHFLVK